MQFDHCPQCPSRGDDEWVDECLAILREGLAEFPQNERLLLTLADTLSEAGWRRHKEWLYYDDEGFIQHNYDVHKSNEYWTESIKLCEYLVNNAADNSTVTKAIHILVLLYRNVGENEKAIVYAQKMPELKNCREILLSAASDGKEEAKYIGDFLLKTASQFAQQLVYGLIYAIGQRLFAVGLTQDTAANQLVCNISDDLMQITADPLIDLIVQVFRYEFFEIFAHG